MDRVTLKDRIKQTLMTKGKPGRLIVALSNSDELANLIIKDMVDSVPDLVWEECGHQAWRADGIRGEYNAGYDDGAYAQLWGGDMWSWSPDNCRLLSDVDAKAAANAHNKAQAMRIFGMQPEKWKKGRLGGKFTRPADQNCYDLSEVRRRLEGKGRLAEVAEAADCSPQFVCMVRAGRRKPSKKLLQAIGLQPIPAFKDIRGE